MNEERYMFIHGWVDDVGWLDGLIKCANPAVLDAPLKCQ